MYFTYRIQRISQDFNSKFWCFYYIHMGSIILHSCMFTALSVIPQLSGKNREILKEKQFRLKDWAPLWIFSDPWNSFFWGFLWWMWKAHRLPTALAGNRTPWTGWLQRSCWVFWPLFQSFFFFLLGPGQHFVNIKDFMVFFKREPALHFWPSICFASGIKDSRNWPQNSSSPQHWWEFSFPHPCHFACHVLVASPCFIPL